MVIQLPFIFTAAIVYVSVIATIATVCCIIDTIIYVKQHKEWKKARQQAGGFIDSKNNSGGGI